mgnify:FL=1
MIDNYIEAPQFIIELLKEQFSTQDGELDLQKLSPETQITAYETTWSENRVSFDTYDGVPTSAFELLCERFPQEELKYYFYSHSLMGNSMILLNKNGNVVSDPEYEAMMEAQEAAMWDDGGETIEHDDDYYSRGISYTMNGLPFILYPDDPDYEKALAAQESGMNEETEDEDNDRFDEKEPDFEDYTKNTNNTNKFQLPVNSKGEIIYPFD